MQCRDFEQRLESVLDERGEAARDFLLREHTAHCETCAALLAGQLAVLNAVRRLKRAGVVVREPKRRAERSSPSLLRAAASLAAALLVVFGLVWYGRSERTSWNELTRRNGESVRLGSGTLAVAARGGLIANGRMSNSGQWLLEAPRLPQHLRSYRGTLGELAMSLPAAMERLDDVDRFAPGFDNLRASFGMVWETLVRTIPGGLTEDSSDETKRQRTGRRSDRLRWA